MIFFITTYETTIPLIEGPSTPTVAAVPDSIATPIPIPTTCQAKGQDRYQKKSRSKAISQASVLNIKS